MESTTNFGQSLTVVVILAQTGIEFMNGLENLFGFLNENAKNFVVQELRIRAFGLFRGGRNAGFVLLVRRFSDGLFMGRGFSPGGLSPDREAEGSETVLGHPQNRIVFTNPLSEALQVILDAGNRIGQDVELLPVRNLLAVQQHIAEVALCRGQHACNPVQRNQAEAAANAVQQAGDMLDFPGIPLRGNEIDDGGFHLLQSVP